MTWLNMRPSMRIVLLAGACLAFTAAAAFSTVLLFQQAAYSEGQELLEDTTLQVHQALLAKTMDSQVMGATILLGQIQPLVKQAVSGAALTPKLREDIGTMLTPIRQQFAADGIYLISAQGVILLHDTDGKNSEGIDVSHRPYFQVAIRGGTNVFAAVGGNTNERGLYYSAPVHEGNQKATASIGVVVAKLPGGVLDAMLAKPGCEGMLLSPEGVVFASTRSEWLYAMTPPASAARTEQLKRSKRFGKVFEGRPPSLLSFDGQAGVVRNGGSSYAAAVQELEWGDPAGKWTLVVLHDREPWFPQGRKSGIALVAGGLALLLGLLLALLMENRLRHAAQARHYRTLGVALEVSPLAVMTTNAENQIQWVNRRFEKLTQYSPGEVLGLDPKMLACGADASENYQAMWAALGAGRSWSGELVNQRKDGSDYHVRAVISPVRDAEKKLIGYVGLQEDITERMRLEEAVRESELKYRELVENANSIILKLDMEGRITFFNEFAQTFFGFSQEEILGQSIVGTIVPEAESTGRDLAGFIQSLVADPGQHARSENENITKDGERVWVGWTNQAVIDEASGEALGVLCVGSDVTAQKIAQMQRDEALELIEGSIRYASRIQQAVLPAPEFLAGLFAEHFVLWRPRDVVGGDIYWSAPWGRGSVFVLGDCTGHGVPGAFMTLITTGALAKALRDVTPGDVAGLVAHTHRLVQTGLGQDTEGGTSDDGMELGVCYIPEDKGSLRFCGARFALFCLEGGAVAEHKGDRRGIGYRGIPLDFPYTARDYALKAGQRFFLCTDGLVDQVGGARRRGYGKKRFVDLLLELQDRPLAAHPEHILGSLRAYQGQEKRRDDVSVVGFSVL